MAEIRINAKAIRGNIEKLSSYLNKNNIKWSLIVKIMGGHRLWIGPEHDILSYEPDNYPITYKEVPGGVVLIGNEEKLTGLTKEIVVVLEEEGTNVAVKHIITNNNLWAVNFAALSISVMATGSK